MSSAAQPLDVDAVLFDLDGTLVDTAPDLAGALNRLRQDRGLEPMPLCELRAYASAGARGLVGAGLGLNPPDDGYVAARDAFLAHYAANLCIHSALFAEMDDVLAEIERRALPWGIVTNKATRFTTPLIEALAFRHTPAVVVCGDTTARPKPHPEPLLHAAERLGVPPVRCLYVGDAERDVQAGKAAGMPTIVARYGYIEPNETPDTWAAVGHIHHPRELVAWLPRRTSTAG